jgi:hypothetical protein
MGTNVTFGFGTRRLVLKYQEQDRLYMMRATSSLAWGPRHSPTIRETKPKSGHRYGAVHVRHEARC